MDVCVCVGGCGSLLSISPHVIATSSLRNVRENTLHKIYVERKTANFQQLKLPVGGRVLVYRRRRQRRCRPVRPQSIVGLPFVCYRVTPRYHYRGQPTTNDHILYIGVPLTHGGPLTRGLQGPYVRQCPQTTYPYCAARSQLVWALFYLLIRKLIWTYREDWGVCSFERNARQNHAQKRAMNLFKCGKVKIFGKDSNKSNLNARKKKIRKT